MGPIPPPDGDRLRPPSTEQPQPQENQYPPSVQLLIQAQNIVDKQIDAVYPPEEEGRGLVMGVEERKKAIRIFHIDEIDVLDSDGKPTGNKRVTIVSTRASQLREGESGRYYAFIDYETDSPEVIREGLLRLVFGEKAGGYLDTDSDIFIKENEKAINFQTQETGGVFGTIRGKIDRNEAIDPTDLHEPTYGEVYLVNGSELKKSLFDATFQKSKDQVQRLVEQEPTKKAKIEAGIKELERQSDELEAELAEKTTTTASSTPLDEPIT